MANAQQVDFTLVNLFGNASSTNYDGKLLAGGKIYFYDPGTTDTKTVWQDNGKSSAHAQPVVLDSYGYSEIFADGLYDIKIDDADDVTVNTIDNIFYSTSVAGVLSPRAVTTNYTTTTTGEVLLCDTTAGGNFTITLQTAVGITGEMFAIVNTGTSVLTIDGDGSETIRGRTSITLTEPNSMAMIWSDNTNWVSNPGEEHFTAEAKAHSFSILF